jgi:iron complex outermembrane receptor protein
MSDYAYNAPSSALRRATLTALLLTSTCLYSAVAAAQVAPPSTSPTSGPVTDPDANPRPSEAGAPAEMPNDTEIVVTALKRATSIQQTPLSISAVSAASLTNQNITDSQQLTRIAPNLVINEAANGGSRIIIRNLYASGEPLVGLYYDETPLTGTGGVSNDAGGTTPGVRLFDVERAEVLRGPQGTLYGASSMGGTIRLIFAKPNLTTFSGALNGQLTTVASGNGLGKSLDGMVNLPIINDMLAVRAVGYYDHVPGYIDNSVLGLRNFNKSRNYGGRVLVRFKPTDNLTIDLMGAYQNRRGAGTTWNYELYEKTGQKYDQNLHIQEPQSDELKLLSGTLNWDVGFATLTTVASYSDRKLKFNFDYTPYFTRYYNGTYTRPGNTIPGYANFANDCRSGYVTGVSGACSGTDYQNFVTGWGNLTAYQPQSTKTWTEEARLANADHRLKWTLGVYHSLRKNFTESLLNTTDPTTGLQYYPPAFNGSVSFPLGGTTALDRTIDDTLEQIAGFGELTFDVTDKLSVTAGLRYFDYKKVTGAAVIIPNYIAGNIRLPYSRLNGEEHGKLLKFNASYKFTRDVMAYATANQGYRPGGVNQTLGLPSYASLYESDKLWNYEAGLKTAWFDRKLVINADVFQMDWSNMQISASYQGAFGFITNTPGKSRIRGVEVDATIFPIERLTLHASGSYTSAKLLNNQVLPSGISLCTGSPPYLDCAVLSGIGKAGNTLPYSPKITLQGSIDYNQPVGNDLQILLHSDIGYRSASWTVYDRNAANVSADGNRLPGFATVGFRAGLEMQDGRWGVYAFVNNAFNTLGLTSKASGATSSTLAPITVGGVTYPSVYATSITPRTIGVSFRSKF